MAVALEAGFALMPAAVTAATSSVLGLSMTSNGTPDAVSTPTTCDSAKVESAGVTPTTDRAA